MQKNLSYVKKMRMSLVRKKVYPYICGVGRALKGLVRRLCPLFRGELSIESESFHPDQEEEAEAIPRRMFNEI